VGEHGIAFDLPLLLYAPLQPITIVYALSVIVSGELALYEQAGVIVSTGLLAGVTGINIAHELVHRPSPAHRAIAEVLMSSVCYPHFCVEHVHGHHRRVATPEDPATSRLGESFYAFWARSVYGGLLSFWRIETAIARCK